MFKLFIYKVVLLKDLVSTIQSSRMIISLIVVFAFQKSFGMDLGDELEALFPKITEAAGAAIDVILGNADYTKYQAGKPLMLMLLYIIYYI